MTLHTDGWKIVKSDNWQAGKLKTAKKCLETQWSWIIRPIEFCPQPYMEVEIWLTENEDKNRYY